MLRNNFIAIVAALVPLGNAQAKSIDRLIVVVERAEWGIEAKKVACHKTDVLVWESGAPKWFRELSDQDLHVLVLVDPQGSRHEREIWRERLKTQGCKLIPLKIDRSTGSVPPSQIHNSVHAVLLEVFPDGELIWNENLQRLRRTPLAPPNLQSLSWFAASDKLRVNR